jgi:predicted transcriptional regulator
MKTENNLIDLSRAEYDILRILWKKGQANVREVFEALQSTYGWAYTTTKTMMDHLVKKELLCREEFHGIFLYKPMISRPEGLARLVQFFADRVLETDVGNVVSLFVTSKTLTPGELAELEQLLKEK